MSPFSEAYWAILISEWFPAVCKATGNRQLFSANERRKRILENTKNHINGILGLAVKIAFESMTPRVGSIPFPRIGSAVSLTRLEVHLMEFSFRLHVRIAARIDLVILGDDVNDPLASLVFFRQPK